MAETVRKTLLDLGAAEQIEPVLLLLILTEFSTAKLDPGAKLRALMASRLRPS